MTIKHLKQNSELIAAKVKAARIYAAGTVVELAATTGLSAQAVISAEKPSHNPTITTIMRICEATGMPMTWLVDDAQLLPQPWQHVVSTTRITKRTRIPPEAPWQDFTRSADALKLDAHHLARLQVLARHLGLSRDVLVYQLLNEAMAIKEAQFETVTDRTLDVDLLRAIAEIYDHVEMDEVQRLSREEKNRIIKSIYFELESKGMTADDVGPSDILGIIV